MISEQIAIIFYNTLGLIALWGIALRWRAYKVDRLRQEIFNLRGELFDLAMRGQVSFHAASYARLRLILNSMIRFAHEISFVRLAATLMLERIKPALDGGPTFVQALREDLLDEETTQAMERIHDRLSKCITSHIFGTSIAAWFALPLYIGYTVIRHGLPEKKVHDHDVHSVREIVIDCRLQSHVQVMERQAVEARELELRTQQAALC